MKDPRIVWNYRVVKSEAGYQIHEVHYEKRRGKYRAVAMSDKPVVPWGDTKQELIEDLERMLKDAKHPIFTPPRRWK